MTAAVMAGVMTFAAVPVLAAETEAAAEITAAAEVSDIDLNEWNAEKWAAAGEEEKAAAAKAYVDTLYVALQTDLSTVTEEDMKDIYKETQETLEIMFTQGKEVVKSLQELIDEVAGDAAAFDGGEGSAQEDAAQEETEAAGEDEDGSMTFENLLAAFADMDLADWNADKWAVSTDVEKFAAVLVYTEEVMNAEGTDITDMDIEGFGAEFDATYEFIDSWFTEGGAGDQTLQDYVNTALEIAAETEAEEITEAVTE